DAAVQSYFDKQPWYKKSGKAAVLTDIERFNVALIKQVEKKQMTRTLRNSSFSSHIVGVALTTQHTRHSRQLTTIDDN
ncbi:MAG: YARHG domain-containing protein, partial [Salinivirgaceae bacterium]|nr:YARHG domain-containing protein [Salinivirgaceae bacterium]